MALALATSPAVVSSTTVTVTTASYTPPADTLLVAVVGVGNPSGAATVTTGTVTDSLGSTWTLKKRQNSTSGTGSAEVWMMDAGSSPAARTITLTGSKKGTLLAVVAFTGAAATASQTGATAGSVTTNANTISITPTATGSYIVGSASESVVDYAMVAAASTTLLGAFDDVNNGGCYGTWRSTTTTTTTTAQTYGVTPAPVNETEKVAVEVLAGTGSTAFTASAALTGSGTLTATATQGGTTYRMYAAASPPTTAAADSAAISVGMEFYVTSTASLTAIHWWQPTTSASTATRQGALYLVSTQGQVAVATSAAPSGTGWQTLSFSSPVALTANTRYRAVVLHPGGQYTAQSNYYGSGVDETDGPLVVPKAANVTGGVQGSYTYGGSLAYTSNLFNTTNYGVDVTVAASGGAAFTASAALTGSGALSATTTRTGGLTAASVKAIGTPVAGLTTDTTITLPVPAGTASGDYLVAVLYSQNSASASDWAMGATGFARIGPAFTANDITTRVGGLYAQRLAAAPPASYTFNAPGGSGSRTVGVILVLSAVDPTTPIDSSTGWTSDSNATATVSVPAGGTAGDFTLEFYDSDYSSPNSYAISSYTGGLTDLVDLPNPAGAENTTLSRTMVRVFGGVAPTGGVPAHVITTTGAAAHHAVYLTSFRVVGGSTALSASAGLSGSGALTATTSRVALGAENFESYATGTWAEQSIHGPWLVEFVSGGTAQIVAGTGTNTSKVLRIESQVPTGTNTFSALVTSDQSRSGDIDFTIDMRTLAQLRATSPAAWEVAWIGWNFAREDASNVRYYYVALKPGTVGVSGGFELGKVDQAVFTSTGGQRFLWTDTSTVYAPGTTWHTVRVKQVGARIQVWVDGALKADFTDGPGSGGTPAWGTAGESVLTNGGLALYEEDSRAEFDNLTFGISTASAALGGTGTLTATATPKPTTGAASTGSGALTATATQGGGQTTLPAKIVAGYLEGWSSVGNTPPLAKTGPAILPRDINSNYNALLMAFGTVAANGTVTFAPEQNVANLKTDIAAWKAQGKVFILSIGGAGGNASTLSTGTQQTNFLTSVKAIIDAYGFGGIDWDVEVGGTAPTPSVTGMTAITNNLVATYGPGFLITMAPYDAVEATYQQLAAAILPNLAWVGYQFYNLDANPTAASIKSKIAAWLTAVPGLTAAQFMVGFMTTTDDYLGLKFPYNQLVSTFDSVEATYPTLRGSFIWGINEDWSENYQYATTIAPAVYGQSPTVTPGPGTTVSVNAPERGAFYYSETHYTGSTGGTGTTQTDAFTGTNGAAPSATNWSVSTTTGSTATIQTNALRLVTGTAGAYADAARLTSTLAATADANVTFDVTPTSATVEAYFDLMLRATGTGGSLAQAGYKFEVANGGSVSIQKVTSFSGTVLGSGSIAGYGAGVTVHVNAITSGSTLTLYAWTGGTKPSTPTVQVTDTTYTAAGNVGFYLNGGNAAGAAATWTVDNWSATTGGSATPAGGHVALTDAGVAAAVAAGQTQVFRYFYIERYLGTDTIEQAYLDLIAADLAIIRNNGAKAIIRFAYSNVDIETYPYGNPDPPVARITSHITQLAPTLNTYADVIEAVEAGFIGIWGEWFYTVNYSAGTDPNVLSAQNWTDRKAVLTALLSNLDARIFVLVRYAGVKPNYFGGTTIPADPTLAGYWRRMGYHNDAMSADAQDWGTFATFAWSGWASLPADAKTFVQTDTAAYALPWGGEIASNNVTYAVFKAEMAQFRANFWNPSDFGGSQSAQGWTAANQTELRQLLGHRLRLVSSSVVTSVPAGTSTTVSVTIANDGWGKPLRQYPVWIDLVPTGGGAVTSTQITSADPRTWAPGGQYTISGSVTAPSTAGTYTVHLRITDPSAGLASRAAYSVPLVNTGTYDASTGRNALGVTATITAAGSSAFTATASLSGSGTLTATTSSTQGNAKTVSAGLAGSGALAATQTPKATRTAALTGAGALGAVGVRGGAATLPKSILYRIVSGAWSASSPTRL